MYSKKYQKRTLRDTSQQHQIHHCTDTDDVVPLSKAPDRNYDLKPWPTCVPNTSQDFITTIV